MLDDNLPAFFYKKSPDDVLHHETVYLAYQGSDPSPAYILKHADPSKEASRNCYAAALFDSYNPEVLYGEVLVQPTWSQPTLSQEEIRRNGGIPPPPQANIPGDFTIQLYEPDQQVQVRRKIGNLGISTTYEFDMPMNTFRAPSTSALDRTQSDPSATLATPKLNFVWRKEHKLSKDLTCFLTGKSTDALTKKKNRDPDIAIALFRALKEVTIIEPNLSRVDLEDLKGLEVVVLLGAAAIRDIYFSSNPAEMFNISAPPTRKLSSGGRKVVTPPTAPSSHQWVPTTVHPDLRKRASAPLDPNATGKDPRAQWEIDAETQRLRAAVAAEEKENARRAAQRKAERDKADEAETRRLRKLFEAEQKEEERRRKAVNEETARLRKKYSRTLPQLPTRPPPVPSNSHPSTGTYLSPIPQGAPPPRPNSVPHSMYSHSNSSYGPVVMSGAAGTNAPAPAPAPRPRRSGFFR